MIVIDNPWENLEPPTAAASITARRVDADIPWGFFWARDLDRKYLLVLQLSHDSMPRDRLPRLKGIDVSVSSGYTENDSMLTLRLSDSAQREIFHRLCLDIVASTSGLDSEGAAVQAALGRTWRWHHLLRGGTDERLKKEEQKGLIGELLVLERHLLQCLSPTDALSAWKGPHGSPKDFEVGRICVEAKARRGTATPFVAISSEHQLNLSGTDCLFLHVVDLAEALSNAEDAFTLTDVASRLRSLLDGDASAAIGLFEAALVAAGFDWDDDYSDFEWIEGTNRIYHVSEDFPRISGHELRGGISNVKYSLALHECEPFRIATAVLNSALTGGHDGH